MCPNSQSADYLNILDDQVFLSVDFFSIFQDDPVRIRRAQTDRVAQGARDIMFTWSPDLNPSEDLWDVLELCAVVRLSRHQYKILMQHWTERNLVTLQKLIETMQQRIL